MFGFMVTQAGFKLLRASMWNIQPASTIKLIPTTLTAQISASLRITRGGGSFNKFIVHFTAEKPGKGERHNIPKHAVYVVDGREDCERVCTIAPEGICDKAIVLEDVDDCKYIGKHVVRASEQFSAKWAVNRRVACDIT
ncbi:MAG TPA: hypothetical protein VL860_05300 [Planctomycetota bacterium]|nr:hypothetical protein [Planctomycetota bacterium]